MSANHSSSSSSSSLSSSSSSSSSPPEVGVEDPAEPVQKASVRGKLGTFGGVFTPTVLTILGVIMYLRLGWVVGNGGLVGAFLVMGLAIGITTATGLSLSSIATNTRLGAGGPYAIVSRSLGLEVGGSIGVPLYLSQALAVAMYIFGIREGWAWIYPDHPAIVVDLVAFAVVFAIGYASANLAFRIQYVVMVIIVGSLVSIFAAKGVWVEPTPIQWFGNFENADGGFWVVFAVFFPAATGIMAGANMSGDLANPRRSIPMGTLSAIVLSTAVYMALAVWLAMAATPSELMSNYTIMIEKAVWGEIVLAGLLGATFSSALSSLVGAPRILMALGKDKLLPGADWYAGVSRSGEPRRAMMVTGVIVLAGLLVRDLNLIAPLITMFFLITYATINLVVLIESSMGLVSFRPTLRIPRIVPAFGAFGCMLAMFIVNATFGLLSVGVVIALFVFITRRGVNRKQQDVRSGLFVAMAGWAAAKVAELNISDNARGWKPSLLVPVEDVAEARGDYRMLLDVCRPEGAIKLLGLAAQQATVAALDKDLKKLGRAFSRQGVFTTWSTVDVADFNTGLVAGMQALRSAFFRPNALFVDLPSTEDGDARLDNVMREFRRLKTGVILNAEHPRAGHGEMRTINLWLPPGRVDVDVTVQLKKMRVNLAILLAYRITKVWNGELNIITVVDDDDAVQDARAWIAEIIDLCRLQSETTSTVLVGAIDDVMSSAPQVDLHVLGAPLTDDLKRARIVVSKTNASCLFAQDSGGESAVA